MSNQTLPECIRLEQRFPIERIRQKYGHVLSSHAFVNLFLWKKQMNLRILVRDNAFFVKTGMEGSDIWFFPCGGKRDTLTFIEHHMDEPDFGMVYLREEDKDLLEECFPGRFRFSSMPESDEYIFDRNELEQLSGSKFANIRNQVNRLFREHEILCRPYAECDESAVWDFLHHLEGASHRPGYHMLTDSQVPQAAMTYRAELGLYLVTVWADGILSGISMGFPLTGDTMDGCVERHLPSIHGLSCFTQMSLIREAPPQYHYMNGEEDLGLSGLRTMKHHMNPCHMNRIWRADIKHMERITI